MARERLSCDGALDGVDGEGMIRQKTLKTVISAKGVGLHSGAKVFITIRPAPANTGIVFFRADLAPDVPIRASVENVVDTTLATTLGVGDLRVSTVEHLMAALAGLEIDNAFIDLSAGELPVMDGSAAPFVYLLQNAGIEEQKAPRRFVRIVEPVEVRIGDVFCALEPWDGLQVDYELSYDHPVFRQHTRRAVVDVTPASFVKEISRARTFGLLQDYETLRARNLALGGSLDNAVVVDDFRILNEEGLRLHDEFVKHKVLDAVGDLYLLGCAVLGRFRGFKSGHGSNNVLLRKLLATEGAYQLVTADGAPAEHPVEEHPVEMPGGFQPVPAG